MTPPREWWRRAMATFKDRRTLCLTRVSAATPCYGRRLNPDLNAAVIRATTHDEHKADHKSAGRVLSWARASPSLVEPLIWAIARRAGRTRNWVVAIKSLMLAHGLLLLLRSVNSAPLGRLPFDLSDFRDRRSCAFSAFVRAYFNFLDRRSTLDKMGTADELERVERMQELLELLMQVRPYGDGMEVGLVLEAMGLVVVEIFEVYSGICGGIAAYLVGVLRSLPEEREETRRRGVVGVRALRKAGEQGTKLAAYFELCQRMGVAIAAELPAVESVAEEDILDLEKLVLGGVEGVNDEAEERRG